MLGQVDFCNSHSHFKEDIDNDQVDHSIADAGNWHGNRNNGIRSGLVGWL